MAGVAMDLNETIKVLRKWYGESPNSRHTHSHDESLN